MKKIFILFAYCLLLTAYCSSQSWQWAKHFGSMSNDYGSSICTDTSGNLYLAGQFTTPKGIFGTDTITTNGMGDAYIVKFDGSGNFIWAKRAGGFNGTGNVDGAAVIYESLSNSLIVWGNTDGINQNINGSCNFGSGDKGFLAKLDLNGNCLWTRSQPSAGYPSLGSLTIDNKGSIYLSGSSVNTTFFTTSSGIISIPGGNWFIAKCSSSNGDCIWAKKITNNNDFGGGIKYYYNNNLYVWGLSVNDTLKIDTATVYCYNYDPLISKFDTNGTVQWVKTMGGPNLDRGGY